MRIAGTFSFNRGQEEVTRRYPDLLGEVNDVIEHVVPPRRRVPENLPSPNCRTMPFDPRLLNRELKKAFRSYGDWQTVRVPCHYPPDGHGRGAATKRASAGAFREIDFVKRRLGIGVQFGESASLVCSVCARMTIFHNLGHIDCGIEIVPVRSFAEEISIAVSYFEQFIWDLENRGVADIDIPVLILGIDA